MCIHTYIQHEAQVLKEAGVFNEDDEVRLMREKHIAYVLKGLRYLGPGFICLDASRPWLSYWMLHSLDLLRGVEPRPGDDGELLRHVVATLASCQNAEEGGFGGGPQQLSHCAPTYAGVLSLMVVGTEAAYAAIDRRALYRWFMARKHPSGGFCMHDDGEVDVRGTYTVISVASLLNLLTPELVVGVGDYLLSCQTYEGGFGGEPGQEAHGGYVFCAFAALVILGRANEADLPALESWLVNRQMSLEGGFQGRTNKLVDGCYSFWQGATGVLIELVKGGERQRLSDGQALWELLSCCTVRVPLLLLPLLLLHLHPPRKTPPTTTQAAPRTLKSRQTTPPRLPTVPWQSSPQNQNWVTSASTNMPSNNTSCTAPRSWKEDCETSQANSGTSTTPVTISRV